MRSPKIGSLHCSLHLHITRSQYPLQLTIKAIYIGLFVVMIYSYL